MLLPYIAAILKISLRSVISHTSVASILSVCFQIHHLSNIFSFENIEYSNSPGDSLRLLPLLPPHLAEKPSPPPSAVLERCEVLIIPLKYSVLIDNIKRCQAQQPSVNSQLHVPRRGEPGAGRSERLS